MHRLSESGQLSVLLSMCLWLPAVRADEPSHIAAQTFFQNFCLDCHDRQSPAAKLDLAELQLNPTEPTFFDSAGENWERVIRKLQARQMPPFDSPRPSEAQYDEVLKLITSAIDRQALANPRPGRTESLRRLNRTEYQNSIRDLLNLEIDVTHLLPPDELSGSFDNITVTNLSPTLLNRYISAAEKISRLAVGGTSQSPLGDTFRARADLTQEEHVPGLPIGTRGGMLIPYTFPQSGQYEIQIRLSRDRNEEVEGLREPHALQFLLDRALVSEFIVKPPKDKNHSAVDTHLVMRFDATAGPHQIGVTFVKKSSSLMETKREPYAAHFNMHRHPRLTPAIYQVSIAGPFSASQATATTPSRQRIFVCQPNSPSEEAVCAERILMQLMRRAYRRPVVPEDLVEPMRFFAEARSTGNFDAGIEAALSSILVSPHFLMRVERDPVPSQHVYKISDLELASRLSYFLWSSLPDDELLELAQAGRLSQPEVLEQQTRRMLADAKSRSLVTNFAAQWLYLRNLESISPDLRLFPDFDDNLRQAFREETELFFESIVREDRNVLDLLQADYTYLNERLAKHYGIPHIYGSRMRRVALDPEHHRGGLLRHGSVLTVTSYATRTSPVIRGHWILKNLVGAPPPPPPPDVPALKDNTVSATLSIRERLAEHRRQPACASCHNVMDPIGFALENYDAVGRWRESEFGQAVDASGQMLDGQLFVGVQELEKQLLKRGDLFVTTLAEKLLSFSLGRGLTHLDAPSLRQIVDHAQRNDNRFSSLVVALTQSAPFTMRSAANEPQ